MERELVRSLPKAVLHDHLDGGLRVGTILELADAAGYTGLPAATEDGLAEWFHQGESGSLVEYLAAFDQAVAVMQTPEALSRIAYECLLDHAAENVVYAEIRFAPALHTRAGLSLEAIIEAVIDGMHRARRETGVAFGVLIDALRHQGPADAVVRAAIPFLHTGVVGFDLSGPEAGHPPDEHLAECRLARESGLGLTLHAGEAAGPESIWRAYGRCHAQRIGHGVRIVEDTIRREGEIVACGELARTIRDHRVLLEVCPTSNLHTGIAPSPEEHPLGALYRAGFNLSISTDNRLMSDVTMTDEYFLAVVHHGFNAADLAAVTVNALEAGFGDWPERRRLRDEVVIPAYRAVEVRTP
ncbi:MAG TPA: adenosine deaminase [Acidimicrobiia bacterium]|jgi:adenosine deaminase|nr:adenosine deaminase [Acidimicrobiia bacterium]